MLIPINGLCDICPNSYHIYLFLKYCWQIWFWKNVWAHLSLTFKQNVLLGEYVFDGTKMLIGVIGVVTSAQTTFPADICSLNINEKYGHEKYISTHSRLTFYWKLLIQWVSFWCNKMLITINGAVTSTQTAFSQSHLFPKYCWQIWFWKKY